MQSTIELKEVFSKNKNIKYWDDFYKKIKTQEESTFCKYLKDKLNNNAIVLDIGCGTGRDSFSFASAGYEVVGIDRSEEAINFNQYIKTDIKYSNSKIEFYTVDLSNEIILSNTIKSICSRTQSTNKELVFYLRFLLHSINEETEEILLTTISKHAPKGSYFAAEFRTIEDEDRNKVHDDHYRRFIIAEKLKSDLENKYNFTNISFTKGTGLSIYKDEDPFLARIIMKKN